MFYGIQGSEESTVFVRIPLESKVSKEEYCRSWCTVNQLSLSDPLLGSIFDEQWDARELELLPGRYKKKGDTKASRVATFLYTIMEKELIEDHKEQLGFYHTACKVTRLHPFSKPELYMEFLKIHRRQKLAVTHNGVVALSKLAAQYKNPQGLIEQFGKKESLLEPTIENIRHRAAILQVLDQAEKYSNSAEMKKSYS